MQEDKNIFVTQFYIPDEEKRLDELRYCVSRNINNPLINLVILVVEEGTDSDLIPVGEKIKIEWVSKRPTYCDLFNISLKNSTDSNGLLIISNSDIFLEEDDIIKTKERIKENEAFALSRWDFNPDESPTHHDTWDSQDIWIFKDTILPGEYDVKLGIPGCDNRIAFELQKAGYDVKNPSKTIKSYHYHVSKYRTYNEEDRIKEPYLFINTEE